MENASLNEGSNAVGLPSSGSFKNADPTNSPDPEKMTIVDYEMNPRKRPAMAISSCSPSFEDKLQELHEGCKLVLGEVPMRDVLRITATAHWRTIADGYCAHPPVYPRKHPLKHRNKEKLGERQLRWKQRTSLLSAYLQMKHEWRAQGVIQGEEKRKNQVKYEWKDMDDVWMKESRDVRPNDLGNPPEEGQVEEVETIEKWRQEIPSIKMDINQWMEKGEKERQKKEEESKAMKVIPINRKGDNDAIEAEKMEEGEKEDGEKNSDDKVDDPNNSPKKRKKEEEETMKDQENEGEKEDKKSNPVDPKNNNPADSPKEREKEEEEARKTSEMEIPLGLKCGTVLMANGQYKTFRCNKLIFEDESDLVMGQLIDVERKGQYQGRAEIIGFRATLEEALNLRKQHREELKEKERRNVLADL